MKIEKKTNNTNKEQINFMNLPKEYAGENSRFLIVSIPWENNTSYGVGASKGSNSIIEASKQLEYFDIELEKEIFEKGIELKEIDFNAKDKPENATNKIKEFTEKIDIKKKFPVFLGGDHSVTIGIVNGLKIQNKNDDFDIINFDAHSDFFYSWNGSTNNHRCVNRQLISNHNILILGLRSCDIEEYKQIKQNDSINYILSSEIKNELTKTLIKNLKTKLKNLKKNIYLSIDVDVFDPSIIRNTGTPEPGGFLWNQFMEILNMIFQEKNVIGADIVEFAPTNNYRGEAYSLAKLVHKLLIFNDSYSKNMSKKICD